MFAEAYDPISAIPADEENNDLWAMPGIFGSAHLNLRVLRQPTKAAILRPMHFSRHIAQSHSTFSLLAALLLRVAR